MTHFPSFTEFYTATNRGKSPFPWQNRLALTVAQRGWPRAIGIPTGLGKTACLDIALWALAQQSEREPGDRTAPTRTIYVVNRRLLVDAAYEHGVLLARWLAQPELLAESYSATTEEQVRAVGAVAESLRSMSALGGERGPLHVARIRGDVEIGARSPDPSQPSLMFMTVPMFASRWLFRGYGSSRSMRPIDAALAGIDSLVLLDEAHLAQPLCRLSEQIVECDIGDPGAVLHGVRSRPQIVEMTATGTHEQRFELDDEDLAHPVVRQRINAAKPARLIETGEQDLTPDLASATAELHKKRSGSSSVVFVNSPRRARDVAAEIAKLMPGEELHMLTGRMREREAERERRQLLDPARGLASGYGSTPRSHSVTVVATQTLEVGADLDFDFLVTETAGTRAVTQRLGRLNRLGEKPHAEAVICHVPKAPGALAPDRVYGDEPAVVWTALNNAADHAGSIDLSPGRIGEILGEPADLPPRTGELFSAHLWEYAKTSAPPPGEAPCEVFYEGLGESSADISICWRSQVPGDGERLHLLIRRSETVDIPIWEARDAFEALGLDSVTRLTVDCTTVEAVELESLRGSADR